MAGDVADREFRCPNNLRRLFAKLRASGEQPRYVEGDNLIEFHCRDCSKAAQRYDSTVIRIVHRYAITGELVESETYKTR